MPVTLQDIHCSLPLPIWKSQFRLFPSSSTWWRMAGSRWWLVEALLPTMHSFSIRTHQWWGYWEFWCHPNSTRSAWWWWTCPIAHAVENCWSLCIAPYSCRWSGLVLWIGWLWGDADYGKRLVCWRCRESTGPREWWWVKAAVLSCWWAKSCRKWVRSQARLSGWIWSWKYPVKSQI